MFPNPTDTNESDGTEVSGKLNETFDEIVTSETIPRWCGRGFSEHTRFDISYRAP